MNSSKEVRPARDRILDAASSVMRERGLASATTKAIARAAGYSEAMLYKHFDDKQELFLAVLEERMPGVRPSADVAGTGSVTNNLEAIVVQLLAFFVQTFPIAASIFSAPELLAEHRIGVESRGFGPSGPIRIVRGYLDAEVRAGRVSDRADLESVARALVGFAFHQSFLAAFAGRTEVADAATLARGAVAVIAPVLTLATPDGAS